MLRFEIRISLALSKTTLIVMKTTRPESSDWLCSSHIAILMWLLLVGVAVRVPWGNRDFAFFVFERTKHQPCRICAVIRDFAFFCVWTNETSASRNLCSYLVLQRLCNEAALSPALMHFCTKSWSKMVVSWRYADLSIESGWSGQEMFV